MSTSNNCLYVILFFGDVLTIAGVSSVDSTSSWYLPEAMVLSGAAMIFFSVVKIAGKLRKEAQP